MKRVHQASPQMFLGGDPSALSFLVGLLLLLLQSRWTQLPGPLDADPQAFFFLRSLAALG